MSEMYTLAEDPDMISKKVQTQMFHLDPNTPVFHLDPNFNPPVPYSGTPPTGSEETKAKTPMFGLIEGSEDMWFFGYRVNKMKYIAAIIAAVVLILAAWFMTKPKKKTKPRAKRRRLN